MIEVFYIAYLKKDSHWGLPAFNKFLASYEKYGAGIEHKLTILLRAFENNLEDYNKIKEICSAKNIKTLDTIDVGLDFGAYLDSAKQSDADYICCLNTSCEIMCDDWLKKLYSPIEEDNKYQMVGISGAYDPCPNYIRDYRSVNSLFGKVVVFFKRLNLFRYLYRYLFATIRKGYPNYHLRTPAFLIKRELLTEYFEIYDLPTDKLGAYRVEGDERHSLSQFVLTKGFDFCVADKFGVKFDKQDFDKSETYCSEKKNYIIKDRQQEMYENWNFLFKIYMRRTMLGKFI